MHRPGLPGIAIAQPSPEVPNIPEVDETFALNYAAGFVIGAAMASSCPQHVEQFDAALGEEFDVIP